MGRITVLPSGGCGSILLGASTKFSRCRIVFHHLLPGHVCGTLGIVASQRASKGSPLVACRSSLAVRRGVDPQHLEAEFVRLRMPNVLLLQSGVDESYRSFAGCKRWPEMQTCFRLSTTFIIHEGHATARALHMVDARRQESGWFPRSAHERRSPGDICSRKGLTQKQSTRS